MIRNGEIRCHENDRYSGGLARKYDGAYLLSVRCPGPPRARHVGAPDEDLHPRSAFIGVSYTLLLVHVFPWWSFGCVPPGLSVSRSIYAPPLRWRQRQASRKGSSMVFCAYRGVSFDGSACLSEPAIFHRGCEVRLRKV